MFEVFWISDGLVSVADRSVQNTQRTKIIDFLGSE